MSYLVLARKYRPRNFREMVGQPHVVTALGNALVQKRLHHAYLFTGTRGVGKTTVSRILAKSLNCVGPDGQGDITAEPCGVCEACRAIDAGNFVDYTELDAASNRGVDEVQQLLEQAVYKPVQGRFKVFMIDEVHMLTNTAFNAMLKTLEEPPEYLKFVLATTDPQKVPVTVLSRCLQFNLRPMAPETVLSHLSTVLQAENVAAEPGALTLLSRAARGSMRDALSLTDQAIAFGGGSVQEATVRQMLGAVDRQLVFQLIEALAQADGQTLVALVDQARTAGLNAASLLEDMAQVLQHMAVMQAVGQAAPAGDDPDQVAEAALAAQLPRDETQLLYSLCIHGRAELGLAPDEYAGLTMVLLRLLAFKPEAEKKTLESARLKVPALGSAGPAPIAPAMTPAAKLVPPAAAVPAPAPVMPAATPVNVAPASIAPQAAAVVPPPAQPVAAPVSRLPPAQPVAAQTQAPVASPAPVAPIAPSPAAQTALVVAPAAALQTAAEAQPALRVDQAVEIDEHKAAPEPQADFAPADDAPALSDEDEDLGPPPVPSGDLPPWEAYADEGFDNWEPGPQDMAMPVAAAQPSRASAAPMPMHEVPLQALPVREAGHAPGHFQRDERVASPASGAQASAAVSAVAVTRVAQDPAHLQHEDKPLAPLQRTELGTQWHELVTQLVSAEAVNGFVRELALQSELIAQDGARWQLRCASALLGNANSVDKLQAAMREAGHAVQIEVTQGDVGDTPALRNQHAAAAKLNAARSLLEGDPFVQALQRDFAATIVPHSIKPL